MTSVDPPDRRGAVDREQVLFESAISMPAGERHGFLIKSTGDDKALVARIERLISAHESTGGFMDEPAANDWLGSGDAGLSPTMDFAPGSHIGRYRIIEEIGRGGFGIVYRAEQEAPVHRLVALKLVKLGMDTREVIARFESERQALAMMDHPNIATVFDGGATDTGRPYFVMEFVSGVPITRYCDEQRLDVASRLELFTKVCSAVQHAHQKGIIHRDIKPSNVLVSMNDGSPVPKVIDFGIAKATGQNLSPDGFTSLHAFVGTPAYMSPEQALQKGDVDTRADIYSLGALLYELLAGRTPFDTESLAVGGYAGMQRLILEKEPARSSLRFAAVGREDSERIAHDRGTDPARLMKALSGDIDWILARCLEKDRARRYETANGLALDLQRHLDNEPVVARPATLGYRAAKFVRRHTLPVASGLALFLALAGGLAGTLIQAQRARRAQQDAAREAAASNAVSEFLRNDLLAQANPENQSDRDLKLRTVLDRAAEKIEGRFEDQPLVEADVRETLAATYLSLGDYAGSRKHWERAFSIREALLGAEDAKTLRAATNLATALRLLGKFDEAAVLTQKALEARRRHSGPEAPETLTAMAELGAIYLKQGKLEDTARVYAEVLESRRRVSGPDDPETITAMNNLAGALLLLGKLDEGGRLRLAVLESATRVLGPEHPNTLMAMHNVAHMYLDSGDYAEAERHSMQALEACRRVLGPEHPNTLISLATLARIYSGAGKFSDAERMQGEILEIQRRKLGPDHPDTIITMHNLTMRYRDEGKLEEAETLCTEALEKFKQVFGPEHRYTLNSMGKLAGIYCDRGKYDEAVRLATSALEICERALPPGHANTTQVHRYLGIAFLGLKKLDDAESHLRSSLSNSAVRKGSWEASSISGQLGHALYLENRPDEAEPLLLSALQAMKSLKDRAPPIDLEEMDSLRRILVRVYRDSNRPEAAAALEAEAGSN